MNRRRIATYFPESQESQDADHEEDQLDQSLSLIPPFDPYSSQSNSSSQSSDLQSTAVPDAQNTAVSDQQSPTASNKKEHKHENKKAKRRRTRRKKRHQIVPVPASKAPVDASPSTKRATTRDMLDDIHQVYQQDVMHHERNVSFEKEKARLSLSARLKKRGASALTLTDGELKPDSTAKKDRLGRAKDSEYLRDSIQQAELSKVHAKFQATQVQQKTGEVKRKSIRLLMKGVHAFAAVPKRVDHSSRPETICSFVVYLIKGEWQGSWNFLKESRKRFVDPYTYINLSLPTSSVDCHHLPFLGLDS